MPPSIGYNACFCLFPPGFADSSIPSQAVVGARTVRLKLLWRSYPKEGEGYPPKADFADDAKPDQRLLESRNFCFPIHLCLYYFYHSEAVVRMSSKAARAIRNILTRTSGPAISLPTRSLRTTQTPLRHFSSTPITLRRAQSALPAFAPSQTEPHFPPPASPVSGSSSRADDEDLRAHFDQLLPTPSSSTASSSSSNGLFLFPPLTDPSSLSRLTERTLIHGHAIVQRIRDAPLDSTGRELRLAVKNLDRLSDLLCGVIDMCELVRNVHPDSRWVDGSDMAYERLCSFMNELNTDQGLYKVSLQLYID